jgi:hypothetical protein
MIRLRRYLPPQWRQLVRGTADPWLIAGIVGAILGGAWLLSPVGAAAKLREVRGRLEPTAAPNATGRALGYRRVPRGSGGDPLPLSQDSLDVLARGAGIPSHMQPRLMGRRLPTPVIAPRPNHLPNRQQDLRHLAIMPTTLPPPPGGNPATTAADVLYSQFGRRPVTNG